jgi:chemotaxis signal transduction protein
MNTSPTLDYKGLQIHRHLRELVSYMEDVETYRERMASLQGAWDTLALLGQLTGSATGISGTRAAFKELTEALLNQLAEELLHKTRMHLRTQAQNAIDLLVRNLFERTADIGFLADDHTLARFLAGVEGDTPSTQQLRQRLQAYVAKYSVYRNVLLADSSGRILCALDPALDGQQLSASLVQALEQTRSYVESYRLEPVLGEGRRLLYGARVGKQGLLVLEFALDTEMAGIHEQLKLDAGWAVIACVDADGTVVSSSSPIQVPPGCRLPLHEGHLLRFAGRLYVAEQHASGGYQGYRGPGWTAVAMVPADHAFHTTMADDSDYDDQDRIEAVIAASRVFPDALRDIPRRARAIQQDLSRTVWNGSVGLKISAGQGQAGMGNAEFAKILLWEISNAGRKMQAVFDQSISNLNRTILNTLLDDLSARAALAADIMDRNLYERANDVRWWALDERLVQAARQLDGASMEPVLARINDLYTVYDRLLAFDAQGVVLASSRPGDDLVGSSVPANWLDAVASLRDPQDYAVSAWEPCDAYGGRASYVYLSAFLPAGAGGLAIVFDAEPQFSAMLSDVLPDVAGAQSHALFMEQSGARIGATSGLPESLWSTVQTLGEGLEPGGRAMTVVTLDGRLFALGVARNAGYREFNRGSGYSNPVLAAVALDLGPEHTAAKPARRRHGRLSASDQGLSGVAGRHVVDLATFRIGGLWFGIPTEYVQQAIDLSGLTQAALDRQGLVRGFKMHDGGLITVIAIHQALDLPEIPIDPEQAQIIVLSAGEHAGSVGLLVDSLGGIPRVDLDRLQRAVSRLDGSQTLVEGVFDQVPDQDGSAAILTLLSVPGILRLL